MFGLGVPELIFILLLALLIFGPKKLPEIGRTLGKGMSEFRKASTELTRSINAELSLDEDPVPPQARVNRMEALREPRTPTSPTPLSVAPAVSAITPTPPLHEGEEPPPATTPASTEATPVAHTLPPVEPS